MRYCLRSRCAAKYLIHADEIKVDYRDRASIDVLSEKYPNATIILQPPYPGDPSYDWNEIVRYDLLTGHKFVMNTNSIVDALIVRKQGFKFMINTEVTSMWELSGMQELGAEYAYVGIPLFFNLEPTLEYDIKLRTVPTVAYNHILPHENGICGQWIRPEDIDAYEGYIYVFEFEKCPVEREEALYRIYAMRKEWPNRLDLLIEDLGAAPLGRLIKDDLIERRFNCKHKCFEGGECHACETAFKFASEDNLHKIKKQIIEK